MSLLSMRHIARGLRCLRNLVILPALVLLASLQCVSPFGDSGNSSQPNVVALSKSVVTLSDTIVASGAEATAILQLKDTAGANVKLGDASVQFAVSGGGSTVKVDQAASKGDGQYTARLTGLVAGSPSAVTATVNGAQVTAAPALLRVIAGPPSVTESRVSVQREEVPSGSTIWLQLDVQDAAKNPVRAGDLNVAFTTSGGASEGTIGAASAQGDGAWRANFTATRAGTPISVGATINGQAVTSARPTVTVTPGTVSSNSVITVSQSSVASGDVVTVSLQGRDPSGNNLTSGGLTVAFTQSGGTSTGSFSGTVDHGNGTYNATFIGAVAGTPVTIGATIGGSEVTTMLPTVVVHPGPANVGRSVLELSSTDIAMGETVALRLRTRDGAGNSLHSGGLTVRFSVSGSASGSVGATTDQGDGTYAASFSATAAGTATIGATINGNAVTSGPVTLNVRGSNQPLDTFPSHEPAGWIGDTWDMSSASHPGWRNLYSTGMENVFTLASDAGSRGTPPSVGRWTFPAGLSDRGAYNNLYRYEGGQSKRMYVAYWWKPGDGMVEARTGDGYQMTASLTAFQDGTGPKRVVATISVGGSVCRCDNSGLANGWLVNNRQYLGGNVNGGNYVVTPERWYRIEFYFQMSSGSFHDDNADGIIRWWVNGTLVGDYTNVHTGSASALEAVLIGAFPWPEGKAKTALPSDDQEEVDDIRLLHPPPPTPGTVRDLQVGHVWSNAALLWFHETDNGYGSPANYEVRYAPTPMSWGSASDAPANPSGSGGSCMAPFIGSGSGRFQTCYVVGLAPGVDYEFQIIAYRGTLNQDAVFGELSNQTATTTSTTASDIGPVTNLGVMSNQPGDDPRTVKRLVFDPAQGASGQPLRYDIRYGTAPFQWGSASSVRQGDCTDFTARAPDLSAQHQVHCAVEGLTPGTHYYFQLIPYRGTLDRDAVYGPLSNVVEATTDP